MATATLYHDVSTKNGLLTIKMDTVRIRTGFERIMHKVNLEELKQNINFIENLANSLNMSDHIGQTLNYKLRKAHEKLFGFYPKRVKRGLINALGTTIKFITGNPDQQDLDLINQNLEILEHNSNNVISNQIKQIKINNVLQETINKVSKTLRSIKEQINENSTSFRKDLELINLIFNIDILTKILEDLEEQIAFAKNNYLNKNILSPTEREYIWKFLKNQHLNVNFEDEIYKFVQAFVSLQNNHIIIIVKIPIIDHNEYTLMQLEPVNMNETRIDTDIRYVANHQQTFYEQKERCFICVNDYPVTDECVFNILVNQKAKCPMHKQPDQPIVKEISTGTVLINTHKAVHIFDSCGDSRIVSTPTIIETGNCTVTVQNLTFKGSPKSLKQHEYLTPIFGKEIEVTQHRLDIEEVHEMNLNNLEEIRKLKLHITGSQALGGIAIASIVLLPLFLLCIRRYKIQSNNRTKKEDIVTLRIASNQHTITPSEDNHEKAPSVLPEDKPSRFIESLFSTSGFVLDRKPSRSTEDV